MIYLSGVKRAGTPLLLTPNTGYRLDGIPTWALDNGCFTDSYPGDDKYLALLDKLEPHKDRCLFVALPDVVGDPRATLARSHRVWYAIKHERGWPVALVAQDGLEDLAYLIPWAATDWLFIGGSSEWKLGQGAASLVAEARRNGVRVHMGRVNSRKRLAYAHYIGCDTADGTVLAFDPNRPIHRWVDHINDTYVLGGPRGLA